MNSAISRQTLVDVGMSLLLAILVWPFPLARANLNVGVHVVAILVTWQVMQVLYFVLCMGIWGQTGGMTLMGLEVESVRGVEPSSAQRLMWGAVAGAVGLFALISRQDEATGYAERFSGARLRSAE